MVDMLAEQIPALPRKGARKQAMAADAAGAVVTSVVRASIMP